MKHNLLVALTRTKMGAKQITFQNRDPRSIDAGQRSRLAAQATVAMTVWVRSPARHRGVVKLSHACANGRVTAARGIW